MVWDLVERNTACFRKWARTMKKKIHRGSLWHLGPIMFPRRGTWLGILKFKGLLKAGKKHRRRRLKLIFGAKKLCILRIKNIRSSQFLLAYSVYKTINSRRRTLNLPFLVFEAQEKTIHGHLKQLFSKNDSDFSLRKFEESKNAERWINFPQLT